MPEYMRPFRETQATCRTLATIHVDDLLITPSVWQNFGSEGKSADGGADEFFFIPPSLPRRKSLGLAQGVTHGTNYSGR
jgi:hypothetical protein